MKRRALMATMPTGAAALAGSSFASGPADDSTPTEDPGTGPPDGEGGADPGNSGDPPAAPAGLASVIDLETGPRTYSLVPWRLGTDDGASIALWFDRTATPDHPARVSGSLRNENPFENTFQVVWLPAVGRPHSRQPGGYDHEARLHVAPTEHDELATDVAVERDAGSATVTTAAYGDGEHPADATFTLTRAESAGEHLIAEQLMRGGTDPSTGGGPASRGSPPSGIRRLRYGGRRARRGPDRPVRRRWRRRPRRRCPAVPLPRPGVPGPAWRAERLTARVRGRPGRFGPEVHSSDVRNVHHGHNVLDRNDLPTAEVRDKPECFYLATRDGDRVGVGGLEAHGHAGLLRSVVLAEAARGRGYGTGICDALEAEARERGLERPLPADDGRARLFRGSGR